MQLMVQTIFMVRCYLLFYFTALSGSHWDYGPGFLGSSGVGYFCLGQTAQQVAWRFKIAKIFQVCNPPAIQNSSTWHSRDDLQWWERLSEDTWEAVEAFTIWLEAEPGNFTFSFYSKWKEPVILLKVKVKEPTRLLCSYLLARSAYFFAIDKYDTAGLAKEDNWMNYLQILTENLWGHFSGKML